MGCRQEINIIMKLTRYHLPLNVSLEFFWRLIIGLKALRWRLHPQNRQALHPRAGQTAAITAPSTLSPEPREETRGPKLSVRERQHLIKLAAKIRRKEWRSARKAAVRQPSYNVAAIAAPPSSEQVVTPMAVGESSVQEEPIRPSRGGRPSNPVPRHKRPSHMKAEFKRRGKIQTGFDTLKALVPDISENAVTKESKASMLSKAAEYCRQLKEEQQGQKEEEERLRREIQQLHAEIDEQQRLLPEGGMSHVQKPKSSGELTFRQYLKARTADDWHFWIFSYIARPLFESYNSMVNTASPQTFFQSILHWAEQHLCLVNLRPIGIESLRQISIQSSIMTDPEKLPQEAMEKMNAL